jgi:hypothetical protein
LAKLASVLVATHLCHGPVHVGGGHGQLVLTFSQLKNGVGKAKQIRQGQNSLMRFACNLLTKTYKGIQE